MKDGLVEQQVEQSGIVRLNNEEKHFFSRYRKQSRSNDHTWWVCPNLAPDEVRVPRNSGNDRNGDKESDFVQINAIEEGAIDYCQGNAQRYCVLEMPVNPVNFELPKL